MSAAVAVLGCVGLLRLSLAAMAAGVVLGLLGACLWERLSASYRF